MSDKNKYFTLHSLLWSYIFSNTNNKEKSSVIETLKKIPLFQSLNYSQTKYIANILHSRNYEENEYIFEINQPGAALFIVQEGEVSIELPSTDQTPTKTLAILKDCTFFGELALLDQSPRSASARAVKKSKILALYRKELDELINSKPEIASRIYQSLSILISERLKATNKLV